MMYKLTTNDGTFFIYQPPTLHELGKYYALQTAKGRAISDIVFKCEPYHAPKMSDIISGCIDSTSYAALTPVIPARFFSR